MSKIFCKCGHMIVDQTDNLPYKASVIADQDEELLYDDFFPFIEGLFEAKEHGLLAEYLEEQFGSGYPNDLKIRSIISDAFPYALHSRRLYECEQCGRLWIQVHPQKDIFTSYLPESSERHVLRSVRKDEADNESQ
ncbi:hypothetical protein EPA93_26900 [Ktedonosporobacter rubrisoli]|uniref:Uncharacterized protein n=1 Tax=Ktedonosporobacter rubrisoli TaxID=2509675 RepID=A0A4P6JUU6_KTERU|nr:hypothetical protein [Ktedonosporobacter rubrisoli]QBD79419.1 hypothetical protein EPA93_26900 [Ktedonosporobacter rubrisoli]